MIKNKRIIKEGRIDTPYLLTVDTVKEEVERCLLELLQMDKHNAEWENIFNLLIKILPNVDEQKLRKELESNLNPTSPMTVRNVIIRGLINQNYDKLDSRNITDGQIEKLKRLGVNFDPNRLNRIQASELINKALKSSNIAHSVNNESKQSRIKKTLTESQLKSIIKESVKQCLSEIGYVCHGKIDGYNGDPKGAEEWLKRHPNLHPQEPHDDAWYREHEKHLKDKGVVFEENYDGKWQDYEETLNNLRLKDIELNRLHKEKQKNNQIERFKELERKNDKKIFTPEEAKMMGFKRDDYQDTSNRRFDIWHKGKKSINVLKDINPWEKNSGKTGFNESYISNIVSESIKKVLAEAEIMPSKLAQGYYDVNRITNPDFSVGDEFDTGLGSHPFGHQISYKGHQIGTKLQGGRNLGRDYTFCAPDVDYGNQDGWGRMKWFDRADDYENYVEQNWGKIKELLDGGVDFD